MASIAGALARIKEDLQAYVPDQQVLDACRDAGHVWRELAFPPDQAADITGIQGGVGRLMTGFSENAAG